MDQHYFENDNIPMIDIYEVGKMLGKSVNANSKYDFRNLLMRIPNMKTVIKDNQIFYNRYDLKHFVSNYMSLNDATKLLNVAQEKMWFYIKKYNVELIILGKTKDFRFMKNDDVNTIKKEINHSQEQLQIKMEIIIDTDVYVCVKKVADLVGKNYTNNKKDQVLYDLIPNVRKIWCENTPYYCKNDIEAFLEMYTSRSDIISKYDFSNSELRKIIVDNKISAIVLGRRIEFIYYPVKDIELAINSVNKASVNKIPDGFIPLQEVAEYFDKTYVDRQRFGIYVKNIPHLKSVEINKNAYFLLSDILDFLDTHISKDEALKKINVTTHTFNRYLAKNQISDIILGHHHCLKFYSKEQFNKMYEQLYFDNDKYISIYEISSNYFGITNPTFIHTLKRQLSAFTEDSFRPVKLVGTYHDKLKNRYIKEVYLKEEVESFFSNHISKKEALENLTRHLEKRTILRTFKELESDEKLLGTGSRTSFITKTDYDRLLDSVNVQLDINRYKSEGILKEDDKEYYTRKRAKKILNVSQNTIKQLENQNILQIRGVFKNEPYYDHRDVIKLYERQQNELDELKQQYYSVAEIREIYGVKFSATIKGRNNTKSDLMLRSISLPIYFRGYFNVNSLLLFNKKDIERSWEDYQLNNSLNSVNSDNFKDPYEEFIYKINTVIKVPLKGNKTEELWFEYVRKQVKKTRRYGLAHYVNMFVRTTSSMCAAFQKEIFNYKANEINKIFLNHESEFPRTQQKELYRFLRRIVEAFILQNRPMPFQVDDLNDPHQYDRVVEADLSTYSLDEYHAIYDYVSKVEFHKPRAIQDAINYILENQTTKRKFTYKKYDSFWLYLLVQLTNNWRHSTVITQIPRINLHNTRIKDLHWLKHNSPTIEEANDIIFQIGRNVQHIHKSNVNSEGIFSVGEPLKIAFATAISICELRTSQIDPQSKILIRLTTGEGILETKLHKKNNPHQYFFSDFNQDFFFENRKMNRTLSTLIWSVLRHLGNGLKESQISRAHIYPQTTIEHYIILSDGQVNKLVNELFERNNFGYITQVFNEILFGKEQNKTRETEKLLRTNQRFGDVIKIEATSGLINRLGQEKNDVVEFIKELDLEQLQLLYQNMLAGNLPSKQRYYQCVYSTCKYEDEFENKQACEACAASIINIYALSQLMDQYVASLESFLEGYADFPIGEKRRMSNQFHILYNIVNEAREKFGREIIDNFAKGGTEYIKKLGESLAMLNTKQYLTID